MQKNSDEKFIACLTEARRQDNLRLEEDIQTYEEHVFSKEFEANMQELFVVRSRKKNWKKTYRYVASVAAVVLIVIGVVSTSFTKTEASLPSLDILEWFENRFEFMKGVSTTKDEALVFDETRLGYIPDGFEKLEEDINFTYSRYRFKDAGNGYFSIRVSRFDVYSQQDNENVNSEVFLNTAGYECFHAKREDEDIYIWEDKDGLFYYLMGNIPNEELVAIMDGIQYEGEIK